jgi:predicted HicB family RNase H-like nuclease
MPKLRPKSEESESNWSSFRVRHELRDRVRIAAALEAMSMNVYVAHVLEQAVSLVEAKHPTTRPASR